MSLSTSNSKQFFIAFVSLFGIGTVLFVIGSELLVSSVVIPRSDYELMKKEFISTSADYVAFADSHGANGLVSQDDFVNFSMRGDNLVTASEKALKYVNLHEPKGVVIQADVQQFSSYRLLKDQSALRADFFNQDEYFFQFMRPIYRQYILGYWQSIDFSMFLDKTSDVVAIPIEKGIVRLSELNPVQVKKNADIRAQLHTPISALSRSPQALIYKNTIHQIKASGVDVCMVMFPVSKAYRDAMSLQPAVGVAKKYFRDLAITSDVKFMDYWQLYGDELFSDPDHLNIEGAKQLTNKVLFDCFGVES